jgi:hypothetical protein
MIVLVRPYRKKFRVFSGKAYLDYYHTVRPHLALDRNASMPRLIQGLSEGNIMSMPHVGGLHHGYRRAA